MSRKEDPTALKVWDTKREVKLIVDAKGGIDQEVHFKKAMDILTKSVGFLDTSDTGGGKTIIVCALAQRFGLPLLVVCPKGAIPVWEEHIEHYGIPFYGIFSYEELRARKGSQPKNGLVVREDYETEKGRKKVRFFASDKFQKMAKNSIFAIFDEMQKIKNKEAACYKAASALMRAIQLTGDKARYAQLSASPFDKEEHAISFLRSSGYISHTKLYEQKVGVEMKLLGAQEVINAAQRMDEKRCAQILLDHPIRTKGSINKLIFELFIGVFLPNIRSAMPPRKIVTDTANGFYDMDKEDYAEMKKGIEELARAARYDPATGLIEDGKRDLGSINPSLQKIERAKVGMFRRLGWTVLQGTENHKIIFEVNFVATVALLAKAFVQYNPLILEGSTDKKERRAAVEAFQNDPKRRVLICNIEVGSVAISLHDKVGDAERWMFISPTYKLLSIYQAVGRINRVGVKSLPHTRIVYGKDLMEMNIIEAIAKKSKVVKRIVEEEEEEEGIRAPLPGEYRQFMENETKGSAYTI